MSTYWDLEPEVAGEIGAGSDLDSSVHPPRVSKLEYVFTGWLGDELLETFPCYIVTVPLASALVSEQFTGFVLDDLDIVLSEEFRDLKPGGKLPRFKWLRVTGRAGADDFGLSPQHTLVVSDRALRVLRRHTLEQCDVREFERRELGAEGA